MAWRAFIIIRLFFKIKTLFSRYRKNLSEIRKNILLGVLQRLWVFHQRYTTAKVFQTSSDTSLYYGCLLHYYIIPLYSVKYMYIFNIGFWLLFFEGSLATDCICCTSGQTVNYLTFSQLHLDLTYLFHNVIKTEMDWKQNSLDINKWILRKKLTNL